MLYEMVVRVESEPKLTQVGAQAMVSKAIKQYGQRQTALKLASFEDFEVETVPAYLDRLQVLSFFELSQQRLREGSCQTAQRLPKDEYCRLLGETAEKLAVHACALAAEAGRLESIARTKLHLVQDEKGREGIPPKV